MKKIVLIQGLLAVLVLSGCAGEEVNDLSYERLSGESTIIAFCDGDDDNLVSVSELEACKDMVGYQDIVDELPMVPVEEPDDSSDEDSNDDRDSGPTPLADLPQMGGADLSDFDIEEFDPSNPETIPDQKDGNGPLVIELYQDWFSPEPIKDVSASALNLFIVYDSDSQAASIEAEGELSYATTDGFNYTFADGQWFKVNFGAMAGGVSMSLDGVDELKPVVEVPTNIPVADMPYKASNMDAIWLTAVEWEFKKCENGSDCLEITTVDGGTLRYDRTQRLVEAVFDGELVSFGHNDFEVFIPEAAQVDVPNFGGMDIPDVPEIPQGMGLPSDFDMSQFQF